MKEKEVVRTGRSKTRHATFGFTGGKNGSFYSIGEKYQKLQTKLSREKFFLHFSAISLCRHACENGKGNWSDNGAHRSKAVHGLFTVGAAAHERSISLFIFILNL